jgi:hypothetical protein
VAKAFRSLHSNFRGILANPVLATNTVVTLLLHKGLKFREPDGEGASAQTEPRLEDSVRTHEVGNVTAETELTFEYQLRSTRERTLMGVRDITALPFQVRTKPDSSSFR